MTAPLGKTKKSVQDRASYILSQQNENSPKEKTHILGIYLEGPYFSSVKRGAHLEDFFRKFDQEELQSILEDSMNLIKVVFLAPEIGESEPILKFLKDKRIIIALGNSNANYIEAKKSITFGATLATHTFNGMRDFNHREAGIIGAVLTDDRVYCELIADCVHVHPAAIKLLVKTKGSEKIILVSDSMMATGLSDGEYTLSNQTVIVKDGIATLKNGTLAGSTLTLNKAIYNMVYKVGIPLVDAIKMATLNPARALGIFNKGSIEIGNDADLVIFD